MYLCIDILPRLMLVQITTVMHLIIIMRIKDIQGR
jgi:hypothetical protein